MSGWWTPAASAYGAQLDLLTLSVAVLVALLSAPVFILMAVFAVKYRRGKPADRSHRTNTNLTVEVSWAILPFVLIVGFYVWSTRMFFQLHRPPPAAIEIDVVAKQWMWKFQHPGGQREIDELHVPAGEPVRLMMASQDVIHSLYVPALRLKQDVVPGRYTSMWFIAKRTGTYRLQCAEFCGADHSTMVGRLIVMSAADYAAWLEESSVDQSLAAQGAVLYHTHGCSGCHEPNATVHAPTLRGLYDRPVPLDDGGIARADAQYIRDSILLPQAQIAAGYPRIMPTYANVLGEDEVMKLVAYIKSLARAEAGR
ncbi:MAG: cytochrome c oxidase subunit II [Rhodospirillaceae bacterium]